MAGFCDNHCIHFDGEKCNHPTFPRHKTFLREHKKKCGGFKGTPGINDRETYERKAKERRKAKEMEKKVAKELEIKKNEEHAIQLLEEMGIENREGFDNYFKLNPRQQYFVLQTIIHKRTPKEVMKEVYKMEGREEVPYDTLKSRIRIWRNNPLIVNATNELTNVVADRTKIELEMVMQDMMEKIKEAIKDVDVETSLPEDIIKMTKDLADIKTKLDGKASNVQVGNITFTFGDGSTLADIYVEDDLDTIVIEADFEER